MHNVRFLCCFLAALLFASTGCGGIVVVDPAPDTEPDPITEPAPGEPLPPAAEARASTVAMGASRREIRWRARAAQAGRWAARGRTGDPTTPSR
jgi:hypothetical protein